MELLLRIRWRVVPADDVRVEIESAHTVGELLAAANDICAAGWEPSQPVYLERTGAQLNLDRSVVDVGIISGDTLRFEMFGADLSAWTAPTQAVSCDVLSGPDAGRSVVLSPGAHTIGRAATSAVVLDDAHVSPEQLVVTVGADLSTSVSPAPQIVNPVLVNGARVDGPTPVRGTDVVQFGATAVALRVFARASDAVRDQLGQVRFNRTPHRPAVVVERHFDAIGTVPTRPENRRFAMLAVIAPLGAGLMMWAFSKQIQFLALTLLSPVAMVGNWFEDRRSGKHKYRADERNFVEQLGGRASELLDAAEHERAERLNRSPDLADLARRANLRTLDLWARQRTEDDFLLARLGLGAVRSAITVDPESGGESALRRRAAAVSAGFDTIAAAPVCVDLRRLGVVGFHGTPAEVHGLVGSVLVQAVSLHSPEDLVLVTIEGAPDGLGSWAKWLPHVRSTTSPVAGEHVVADRRAAAAAVRELVAVGRRRSSTDDRADHRWPWVLVVLDEDARVDPALVSQLLELSPAAGISVIATAQSETRVPRQAKAVVQCARPSGGALSTVWYSDPEVPADEFEPEVASAALTDRVALALAPLRDATATTATSSIPRIVPLLSLFPDTPTPMSVAATWAERKPYGLAAPIGTGPSGPLFLDLVEHGPHALIGGTSGAGKSELLQSIVAALVHEHPPTRLTFLFVDYKGGASSRVFSGVPHTVGYVTNLDAGLAMRALTSLRAELNHRMRLMEGRAKDLAEMLEKFPQDAPPSLVIVVDEFATLVKEVPDFVAGIVDVAQRGRSLGIHLILATQRPSGSVNDNILANTNLRISLRMLDNSESNSVIGVAAAADIPVPLKGRGYARLGPRDIIEFQSAFTGAPFGIEDATAGVHCEFLGLRSMRRRGSTSTFDPPQPVARVLPYGPPVDRGPARTHLDVLLEAVAAAMPDLPPPRRPWRETLPEVVPVADVLAARRPPPRPAKGRDVLLGLTDDPAVQNQYPTVVDLEDGGGMLVVGSGGAGKTTVLRTIAVSVVHGAEPDEVTLFVIDCASRALRVLGDLPHCSAAVTGDDLEGVTRVLALLDAERERRRNLLSAPEVQAETLSALLGRDDLPEVERPPRVLLLVDGYQNLTSILTAPALNALGNVEWLGVLHRLVTDGRAVGIHVVLTADRRQALPALLMSAISKRLVLRQTEESGYSDFGVPTMISRGLELAPGRALLDSLMVQVASVSADPSGAAQGAAVRTLAGELLATSTTPVPDGLRTAPPAGVVHVPPSRVATVAHLGRVDVSGEVAAIDVQYSGFTTVGPMRSGRTTALRQVSRSLIGAGMDVWTIGLNAELGGSGGHATADEHDAGRVLDELLALCESLGRTTPRVLVVDDVDQYDDLPLLGTYERIRKAGNVRLVAALEERNFAPFTMNQMLIDARREASILILSPETSSDVMQMTGVRAALRPGLKMSAGRGVLITDRQPKIIHVAQ